MKDRVGNKNPTPETLADLEARLKAIATDVAAFGIDLTAEERVRTTKFRKGGERIVELLARLAQQYSLTLPGLPVESMLNDLALAEDVRPLSTQAESLANTLSDTVLQAESECWWVATAYYTALLRIADSDPKLAEALKPAVDFFSTGRRRKKTETP
ncbi:MAG: hypothetical protein ACOX6T_06110 [Myxococcales bacterium]|jgi:hypothetical protein